MKSTKKSFIKYILLYVLATISIISSFAQYSGGNGDGYNSEISSSMDFNTIPSIYPDLPNAIDATSILSESFNANWISSSGATGYYIDVDDDFDFSSPLNGYNNLDVGNLLTLNVSGLDMNKTYFYRVTAYNRFAESTFSNVISVTTHKGELTITGISINNKIYDGTDDAQISGTPSLIGVNGSDDVSLSVTDAVAKFDNRNAGTEKDVSVTGYKIVGAEAENYILYQPLGLNADINTKEITITGLFANNKVYDGTTDATLSGGTLSGIIDGDDVSVVSGVGAFLSKNIGANISVTVLSFDLIGDDAENYHILPPTGITANISAKILTVTGIVANDKEYDGTTATVLSGGSLSGVVTGDNVSLLSGTGVFLDPDVGLSKAISVSGYVISGADENNYILVQPDGIEANISAKQISIVGIIASDKEYDRSTSVSLTGGSLSGIVNGDNVVLIEGTGEFLDYQAGTNKEIIISGYSIEGGDAGNYEINQPSGITADIIKKTLIVEGVNVHNREYDGTNMVTVSGGVLSGVISGDDVSLVADNATGMFFNKNVGTNKEVTISEFEISGLDVSNYNILQPTGLSANVSAKHLLIINVVANDKEYDGTTSVYLSEGSLQGVIDGDNVTLIDGYGMFNDPNAGIDKIVKAYDFTISGADAGNYIVTSPTGLVADILKATPEIFWDTPSDIYFGTKLDNDQLNATSIILGSFQYTPSEGTVLNVGDNQELIVEFTPSDLLNYNNTSDTVFINVLSANSLTDIADERIIVHPNPIRNIFTLDGLTALRGNTSINIKIIDPSGKIVFKKIIANNVELIEIDASSFNNGLYFLFLNAGEETIIKSIIKI